jgi:hypothetical protein
LSKDLSVGFMRLCGARLSRKYPKFGSRFLRRDVSPCTGVVALLAIQSHSYASGTKCAACPFHRYNQICNLEGRWNGPLFGFVW